MRMIDADALIKWINESRCADCPDKQDERCAACQWDDAIMSIETAPTIGGWISVKDRLPEEKMNPYTQDYQEVICSLSTRFGSDVRVYKFGRGHFWHGPADIGKYITHWMPLPEPPEEVSGDD